MDRIKFGKYLRELRERKAMTVNQLAMYSGVSASLISLVENGKRGIPKPDTLNKLAQALNVNPAELIFNSSNSELPPNARELLKSYSDVEQLFAVLMSYISDILEDEPGGENILRNTLQVDTSEEFRTVREEIQYHVNHMSFQQKLSFIRSFFEVGEENGSAFNNVLLDAARTMLEPDFSRPKLDGVRERPLEYRRHIANSIRNNNLEQLVLVPILGSIRAGQPIEMVREAAPDYELVERDLIHNHDAFILDVKGDSMVGDYIFDGDRVVVIYTPDYSPKDICVVAINGEEATLKRVKCENNVCILSPSNPNMEPMIYPAKDVHVIGVVVEVRRKMRR